MLRRILALFTLKLRGEPITRTRTEVVALLERELAGTVSDEAWDDFLSVPIAEAELEAARQAIPLEGRHSPEGRRAVEQQLALLRG